MHDANIDTSTRMAAYAASTRGTRSEEVSCSSAPLKRKRSIKSSSESLRPSSPLPGASARYAASNRAIPQLLCELEDALDGAFYANCTKVRERDIARPAMMPPVPGACSNHAHVIARHRAHGKELSQRVLERFQDFSAWLPSNLEQTQWKALCQLFALPVSGVTPLHIDSVLGEGIEKLRLRSTELGIDVTTSNGLTPLMVAALNPARASETIAHLLALDADPQRTYGNGHNALHVAASMHDNPAALVPLIEAGLDPFEKSEVYPFERSSRVVQSPLHQAATLGRVRNVVYMLSQTSPGDGHATTALLASEAGSKHHLYRALSQKFPYLMDIPALPLEDAENP